MYKVNKRPLDEVYEQFSELKRKDVEEIVTWTHNQTHLPKITEYEAAIFLHSKYYNLEEAKKRIDYYFTYRTNNPKMFQNRDANSQEIQQVVDCQLHIPLAGSTPEGYKVFLLKIIDPDTKKFNFVASLRACTMMVDWWHMTEAMSNGHIVIVDMQGFSFGHIIRINLMATRTFVIFAQDIFPIRIKGIHFINANRLTQRFISILKPFLKKETYEMIHVHTTMESAYHYIPQDSFPEELGGNWKPMAELQKDARDILVSNRELFLEEDTERIMKTNAV